jgi:hypothetical protein
MIGFYAGAGITNFLPDKNKRIPAIIFIKQGI